MKGISNFFSSAPPFFSELAHTLEGEMDCSQQTRVAHSTDGGLYQILPQAIIYPKNISDIKKTIVFAKEYSMPITPCGGVSSLSGGALGEGIILDMTKHFNRIRHVNMIEHTVTVDAGVTLASLTEKLRSWNMEIPLIGEGDAQSTIGGLLSTKSATSSTFHHGTIREWVEGVTIVVDTGEEHHIKDGITPSGRLLAIYQAVFPLLLEHGPILRAAKPENADDATGYALWGTSIGPRQLLDQLIGSEGTLGIITSVTLRVRPEKRYSATVSLSLDTLPLLSSCLTIAKHNTPENIFMCNETFVTLARKATKRLVFGEGACSYHLLITLRDTDEQKLNARIISLIKALPLSKDKITPSDTKTLHEAESYAFLQKITSRYTRETLIALPITNGIVASPEAYTELLEEIEGYMDATGKLYIITGYAGSGHLSVTVLFDPKSPFYEQDILTYTHDIYLMVKKYNGGISATGGDGLAKTPYLPIFYNDATLEIFKKIKNVWDPHFIFNPSKKVSLSLDTLHKYIRKI